MKQSRILELDGLRFFAVSAVMLLHFSPHSKLFELGCAGVDLFFIISGFLITDILLGLRSDPAPYKKFYWRRLIRIFPPYYAVLAIIAILIAVNGEGFNSGEWMRDAFIFPSLRRGISFHTMAERLVGLAAFDWSRRPFVPGYFNRFSDGMGVYWSLAVEEMFYLFWAPVVLRASRKTIVFCAVAPLVACPILRGLAHTVNATEMFNFVTRFDSIAMGGCIAVLAESRRAISKRIVLSVFLTLCGLLAWLVASCGILGGMDVYSYPLFGIFGYSLLSGIFACLVTACVLWRGHPLFSFLRFRPLVYIGTISYMMYLTHVVFYVGVGKAIGGDVARGILAAMATVAFAATSWKYFEGPILRWRNWPRFVAGKQKERALSVI